MPVKVAPLNYHPSAAMPPAHCDQASLLSSSAPPPPSPLLGSCQTTLCTFIDAALNICASDSSTTLNKSQSQAQSECCASSSAQDEVENEGHRQQRFQDEQYGYQQHHPAPQHHRHQEQANKAQQYSDTTSSRPSLSRSSNSNTSNNSSHSSSFLRRTSSSSSSSPSNTNSDRNPRQETVILPHLRFNTLPSSSSSLQDFYTMFLADNAPHSFQVFHKSYGDENVVATPWKIKQKKKTRSSNENTIYEDEEEKEEERSWGMLDRYERTITYHTKISPGSSSNPLVSSSTTTTITNNSNSLSNNMIPLGVSIIQTLIKNSNTRVWVLQCEFSFDFLNSTSPPSSSSMSSIASSTNTTSNSGSGSSSSSNVGKKLLGTNAVVGGLSQYFMSHVVKGSTVNVSIILRECEEGAGADTWQEVASAMDYVKIAQDHHHPATSHYLNNARGGVTTSSSNRRHQQHHHPQRQTFCQEDIFSCFSHPLLLPPDGLCGSGTSSSSWRAKGKSSYYRNNCINIEEPSKIGASLLSAIKAKNAPSATDFASSSNKPVADVSLAMTPMVTNSEESNNTNNNNNTVMKRLGAKTNNPREQKEYYEQQEDVLAYCSSRGSMKVKNIPSELSRAPSTISMRRMILDKTETTTASANAVSSPSRSRINTDSINTSSPVHSNAGASSTAKFPQGISMRIQMELVDSSSCPSIPTIDDKIRRGLKKRFARSWVSWAESWCMRVWEEEEAERVRKKALGVAMHDPNKKNKVNVRPIVRRVGDLEGKKKKMLQPSEDTPTTAKSSSSSTSSSVSTDDNGWKPMQVKGSPTRKSERWMAMEREDECGVEVECTVSVAVHQQEQQQKRKLKAVDINQNKEQGSNKAPVKRSGLLKHRRNKLI